MYSVLSVLNLLICSNIYKTIENNNAFTPCLNNVPLCAAFQVDTLRVQVLTQDA